MQWFVRNHPINGLLNRFSLCARTRLKERLNKEKPRAASANRNRFQCILRGTIIIKANFRQSTYPQTN